MPPNSFYMKIVSTNIILYTVITIIKHNKKICREPYLHLHYLQNSVHLSFLIWKLVRSITLNQCRYFHKI